MTLVTDAVEPAARPGPMQTALGLIANPVGTFQAASVLLRGAPSLAGWLAGWAITEFPLRVLTGHALSSVNAAPVNRFTAGLAAQRADSVLQEALTETHGSDYAEKVSHPVTDPTIRRHSVAGVWRAAQRSRYATVTRNLSYGPGGRDHLLDIWRRPDITPGAKAPVLLQVPGGAWALSEKRGQAVPLLSRMVELGWICVTINYSRSPFSAWPAHIIDVKRAIAWLRENVADHGGDPEFIAITGGSAGAHIGSLAALTANDTALQPGFEDVDTSVAAAVPYYGAYDLTDPANMCELMLPFLENFVMRARLADAPDLYRAASPIAHVHRDAPPFFVLHGRNDAVIPHTQAQSFVGALRGAGAATVAHAELPNAHHAFDTIATVRSQMVTDTVADFLGITYGRHRTGLDRVVHHVG
ncbi:carboxylesterase LipQ [Mycolicibacterium chitae]|uniref:LipQ n=2 Tax=Mycolicibacterium chitae TaxID=1792 RepID=A0A3S4RLT6_MYCCI|nr:alpha/beta hydrolase [Mycolicibacterium chitae]BBZ03608.1 carboxylesterase LipQ [Mycolicibacterium chitae]VEG47263.1 lipQ [Mycolicibacterium chitae]